MLQPCMDLMTAARHIPMPKPFSLRRKGRAGSVIRAEQGPTNGQKALGALVAKLVVAEPEQQSRQLLATAFEVSAYQVGLEKEIERLNDLHALELRTLIHASELAASVAEEKYGRLQDALKRAEEDAAVAVFEKLQAQGRNDPRGLFEEVERWAKQRLGLGGHKRWENWQRILNSSLAKELKACLASHNIDVKPGTFVGLYRQLSSEIPSFPPLQVFQGRQVLMSRGPLSREDAQVLVCMACMAKFSLSLLEDTVERDSRAILVIDGKVAR